MDATVSLLWARFVLNLSTLHVDDVKNIPGNLPKLCAAAGNLEANRTIIARISHQQQSDYRYYADKQRTFHWFPRVIFTLAMVERQIL